MDLYRYKIFGQIKIVCSKMKKKYNKCIHCKDGKCQQSKCVHFEQCWKIEQSKG